MKNKKLVAAIDLVCDAINLNRNKGMDGIDILVYDIADIEKELCALFTYNGEVLTCEATFEHSKDLIFCWGETAEKHKAWVEAH